MRAADSAETRIWPDVPTAVFRRQLLHKPVTGTRLERQAVLAAECGAAQRARKNISVIADDQILAGFLG